MNKRYMRFLDVKGILSRMENLGIKNFAELARKGGACPSGMYGIMRRGYTNILIATDIASALGCPVEYISSTDDIFEHVEIRHTWCIYEKPTE